MTETSSAGTAMVRRREIGQKVTSTRPSASNTAESSGSSYSQLSSGGLSGGTTVTATLLRRMTREQLRGLLRERGLPRSGNKTDMINRLGGNMSGNTTAVRRGKDSSSDSMNGVQRNAVKSSKSSTSGWSNDSELDPDSLTLWRHPVITLTYFFWELLYTMKSLWRSTVRYRRVGWTLVAVVGLFFLLSRTSGPQQELLKSWETRIIWWLYWVGLGVLSSVGLGTGLHTFVLYLGPHIASVTMAAYECGGLNFPEPPYPDQIVCPSRVDAAWTAGILNIMRKVRVEAMLWGAGTALGELPPYFMARAARLSHLSDKDPGDGQDQEELRELEALEALESGESVPLMMRAKLAMKHFVQKAGFLGILACASIPNPLFDLAGLTCGHYLIPFWTFFGATLVGKAVVKMHIQQLAVIVAFNEDLLDKAIGLLAAVPLVGSKFQGPLKKYLLEQKRKLHDKTSAEGTTTISWLFDKFVMLMVFYFLITIIHALARNHHRRRIKPSVD